jgi:hypothetical protein
MTRRWTEEAQGGRGPSNDGYRSKLYRESSRLKHEGVSSVTSAPPELPPATQRQPPEPEE